MIVVSFCFFNLKQILIKMEGFRRKTTKCQLNRNSILKQHYYIENNNSETDDPPEFPMLTDDINIDNR
jgi:hypothetical protein